LWPRSSTPAFTQLYLAKDGTLAEVWSHFEDGTGEDWTTTSVLPGSAPHQQDIALIGVRRGVTGPIKFTAQRVHYDPATGNIVEMPGRHCSCYRLEGSRQRRRATSRGWRIASRISMC